MTIHSSNEAPFSLPGKPPLLLRSGPPGDFFPDRVVPEINPPRTMSLTGSGPAARPPTRNGISQFQRNDAGG